MTGYRNPSNESFSLRKKTQVITLLFLFSFILSLSSCGLPDTIVLERPTALILSGNQVGFSGNGDPNTQGYQIYYKIYEYNSENTLIGNDEGSFSQSSLTGSTLPLQKDFYALTEAAAADVTEPLILYQGTGDILIDFTTLNSPVITVPSAADIPPGRARPSGSIVPFKAFILNDMDCDYTDSEYTDYDLLDLRLRLIDASFGFDPSGYTVAFVAVARGLDPATLETFYSLPVYLGTIDITS